MGPAAGARAASPPLDAHGLAARRQGRAAVCGRRNPCPARARRAHHLRRTELRRQGLRRALGPRPRRGLRVAARRPLPSRRTRRRSVVNIAQAHGPFRVESVAFAEAGDELLAVREAVFRSEEHKSELQSLMRISYAVFCLKKKTNKKN